MRKKIVNLLIILLIICCSSSEKKEKGTVVVSVGEGILTLEQLNRAIPSSINSTISQEQINNYIQQWIEIELIYQEALRRGMEEDEELKIELENAKRELLVRKFLDNYLSNNDVLEKEARDYYEENKDNYLLVEDEIRAVHILVSTYNEANQAYRRIRNGEDFETVAQEVSIDYSENNRIDLGYFKRNDIVPEISNTLFSYRVGSTTRPLKSEFGYHLFKILDRRGKESYREFEEIKDQIIARLKSMKRNDKYRELIITLRNKINIKKNIDILRQFYNDSTYQQPNQVVNSSQ